MTNKAIYILAAVVCIVLVYQFIVRPIQKDSSLENCLERAEMTPLSSEREVYVSNREACFKQYGN